MTRIISIGRGRLRRWLDNFIERHPAVDAECTDHRVRVMAADGAVAQLDVPFPPFLPEDPEGSPTGSETSSILTGPELLDRLVAHVGTDRPVGAILVRRGGFAAGLFHGRELIDSKVGTGYVQGKTKAGGWSQQRYARRRDQQAHQLYDRAAGAAQTVLLPQIGQLQAVATGGDRAGITAVTRHRQLTPLRPLLMSRVFPVPDPRRPVLESFPDQFLAVRIQLNERA